MMERIQGELRAALCRVLQQDGQVRQDVFDSRLTREGFVGLVFSMLLSALLRGEKSCEPLISVIHRILYLPPDESN